MLGWGKRCGATEVQAGVGGLLSPSKQRARRKLAACFQNGGNDSDLETGLCALMSGVCNAHEGL